MVEPEGQEAENERVVRNCYNAYLNHDIWTVVDSCAEDSEWFALGPSDKLPYAGSYRGRQEVEKYLAILDDVEESNHLVAHEFIACGNKVIVFGEYIARVNSTGLQFKTDFAHVFTLRDGKITNMRYLYDTAAAVAAFSGVPISPDDEESGRRDVIGRRPNTKVDGSAFEKEIIDAVWEKAGPVEGWFGYIKKDECGALICRERYGKTESLGWEIDHLVPVVLGGADNLSNLRPLQWQNNRSKADNYPNWECKNTG